MILINNSMECRKCGSTEDLKKDYKTTSKVTEAIKWYFICRACSTERIRKYRQTQKGKEAFARANQKYSSSHPDRLNAWVKARNIPKQPCSMCGSEESHRHHPDPLKPLDVVFLCAQHHKAIHLV